MRKLSHEAIIIRNHMIRKLKNKTIIVHINNASPPRRKATTASSITAEHTQQARLFSMCTQRVAPEVNASHCSIAMQQVEERGSSLRADLVLVEQQHNQMFVIHQAAAEVLYTFIR